MPDLAALIRKAFPDGIVELPADADEIDPGAAYPGRGVGLAEAFQVQLLDEGRHGWPQGFLIADCDLARSLESVPITPVCQ